MPELTPEFILARLALITPSQGLNERERARQLRCARKPRHDLCGRRHLPRQGRGFGIVSVMADPMHQHVEMAARRPVFERPVPILLVVFF